MPSRVLLPLLLCASFASWPRVSTPPLPPPAGTEFLVSSDGTRLYSSVTGEPRRGVVWFVLGPEIASTPLLPRLTSALHDAGFATAVLPPPQAPGSPMEFGATSTTSPSCSPTTSASSSGSSS